MNDIMLTTAVPEPHHPYDDILRGLPLALAVSATQWCLLLAAIVLSLHIR